MAKKLILFLCILFIISDNMPFIKYCFSYWLLSVKNITQFPLVKKEKVEWNKFRDSPLCETKW